MSTPASRMMSTERVQRILGAEIVAVFERLRDRMLARAPEIVAAHGDVDTVHTILQRECKSAVAELDALKAQTVEQLNAAEH